MRRRRRQLALGGGRDDAPMGLPRAEGQANRLGAAAAVRRAEFAVVGGAVDDEVAERPRDRQWIHELFHAQAARTPNAAALIDGERRFTYSELAANVERLAERLAERGVERGKYVALLASSSAESIAAILAILSAGGAYLPLDPEQPKRRLARILADARPEVVLGDVSLVNGAAGGREIEAVDLECGLGRAKRRRRTKATFEGDAPAYVMYTSGSTGRPKGVLVSHANAAFSTAARQEYYGDPVGSFVLVSPLFFDSSVAGLFWTLATGGAIVLPPEQTAEHGVALPKLIAAHRASHLLCTPSLWRVLLRHMAPEQLESLATVIVAGEPCSAELVDEHFQAAPQAALFNEYGPTEASVWCSVFRADGAVSGATAPIGQPIPGARLYLLDKKRRPVAPGQTGELYVGGPGVALGYLRRPALTRKAFVRDLFAGGDARMYRTGDTARELPDGNLEFLGRVDRQVKIRGYRIELEEVERALSRHPQVAECAVVTRKRPGRAARLAAFVVCQGDEVLTAEQLREYWSQRLPAYMTPGEIEILAALPRTTRGKIDLKLLAKSRGRRRVNGANGNGKNGARERRRRVANGANHAGPPVQAAASDIESQLELMWRDLLQCNGFGRRDDFFQLGGDSLLVMDLVAGIEKQFGVEVSLPALFAGGLTVERLAEAIQSSTPQRFSPLVAMQPLGSLPPIFCVHPGGGNPLCYLDLARQFAPQRPFYAFAARGVDGKDEPQMKIVDMADEYLAAMRTVQPEGPYALCGWSFGGLVAYEMACRLQKEGEKVSLLALIDSGAMYSFAIVRTLFPDKTTPLWNFDTFDAEQRFACFNEMARRVGLIPQNCDLVLARNVSDLFEKNLHAVFTYRPQPYDGKATLILGEEKFITARLKRDPYSEWSDLCRGGVELLTSPGDHVSMIREPHAAVLAGLIEERLEKSRKSSV